MFFRVLSGHKSWSSSQLFLSAESGSVWNKILENHMTDDSFVGDLSKQMKDMIGSNKLLTAYFPVEGMIYASKSCAIKVLWQSSQSSKQSFGFLKNSPLLPFFKYAYKKLRQTGTLKRISEKWRDITKSSKCGVNSLKPISLNKIASLFVLLLIGIIFALIILIIESLLAKTKVKK